MSTFKINMFGKPNYAEVACQAEVENDCYEIYESENESENEYTFSDYLNSLDDYDFLREYESYKYPSLNEPFIDFDTIPDDTFIDVIAYNKELSKEQKNRCPLYVSEKMYETPTPCNSPEVIKKLGIVEVYEDSINPITYSGNIKENPLKTGSEVCKFINIPKLSLTKPYKYTIPKNASFENFTVVKRSHHNKVQPEQPYKAEQKVEKKRFLCKYIGKCKNQSCGYAHYSRELEANCHFGDRCKNKETCVYRHTSEDFYDYVARQRKLGKILP